MSEKRKFWVLTPEQKKTSIVEQCPRIQEELAKANFIPVFISALTELQMNTQDKALVFLPADEDIKDVSSAQKQKWEEFSRRNALCDRRIFCLDLSYVKIIFEDSASIERLCSLIRLHAAK